MGSVFVIIVFGETLVRSTGVLDVIDSLSTRLVDIPSVKTKIISSLLACTAGT